MLNYFLLIYSLNKTLHLNNVHVKIEIKSSSCTIVGRSLETRRSWVKASCGLYQLSFHPMSLNLSSKCIHGCKRIGLDSRNSAKITVSYISYFSRLISFDPVVSISLHTSTARGEETQRRGRTYVYVYTCTYDMQLFWSVGNNYYCRRNSPPPPQPVKLRMFTKNAPQQKICRYERTNEIVTVTRDWFFAPLWPDRRGPRENSPLIPVCANLINLIKIL